MKILCSGLLVRHPIAGHTWHHLQYLVGLRRLGHEVIFFEHYGWPDSCYDAARDVMTADPAYGTGYARDVLRLYGLEDNWCYLAQDGSAWGMSRERLVRHCSECDLYIDLSNLNWIPELEQCRRRVLVDTDPVFTQIGALGAGGPFDSYDALFTFGGNVHRPGCAMPTAGMRWIPTRQPVVVDAWPVTRGSPAAPITTVTHWSPLRACQHEGRVYRDKAPQFEPYFTLPRDIGEHMEIVVGGVSHKHPAVERFRSGGWRLGDTMAVSHDLSSYRRYLQASRAEFTVAKHGYVVTRSGWFGDRSAAYLASGRPVVLEDTGFSDWLPTGAGAIAFTTRDEAIAGIREVNARYDLHCRAARDLAEEYFDARKVLSRLLDLAVAPASARAEMPGSAGDV